MPTSRLPQNRVSFVAFVPAAVLLIVLSIVGMIDPLAAVLIGGALVPVVFWPAQPSADPIESSPPPPSVPPAAVLQETLEQLPDPVIVLNGSREIIAANRAARDALAVGTLGRNLALTLRHPDVLAAVETLAAGVPSLTEEIDLPVPVPRTFTLHAGVLPIGGDPDGPRYVLALHDETRAKRAEQMRADFVANASHELRSPLSSLIGFIETLRGPAHDDAAARERFLLLMEKEAKRMARLVDDLMSLSRVEMSEHVPPREDVDLGEILEFVVETLEPRAAARQIGIVLERPEALPNIPGDGDQLMQVFHNLIDNAVKYSPQGTSIRVVVEAFERMAGTGGAGVAITVIDQGDGIAAIHLPRLTERFYRVDDGRSRRMGGTGLGLAIVKHIVNRHRGRLNIESTVGIGSRFQVLLPANHSGRPDRRQGNSDSAV